MSGIPSQERILSLACFEGLRLLRSYRSRYPDRKAGELIELITKIETDAPDLDFASGLFLDDLIDRDSSMDGIHFYQLCIKSILLKHRPSWSRTMRHGRRRFLNSIDSNYRDVFSAAGLLDDPLLPNVVAWWDDISGHSRLFSDQNKMERGRSAEMLTIEFEKQRLAELGIDKTPEWPGLDDNFAGYDVLSYDLDGESVVNQLIEVKSTTASPLRFFVTRNEWEQAQKAGDSYIFHIWDMAKQSPILHVRTLRHIEPHMPSDSGKGQWTLALVPVGAQ